MSKSSNLYIVIHIYDSLIERIAKFTNRTLAKKVFKQCVLQIDKSISPKAMEKAFENEIFMDEDSSVSFVNLSPQKKAC